MKGGRELKKSQAITRTTLCALLHKDSRPILQIGNESPLRYSTKGQNVITLKSFFRTPPLFRHLTYVAAYP